MYNIKLYTSLLAYHILDTDPCRAHNRIRSSFANRSAQMSMRIVIYDMFTAHLKLYSRLHKTEAMMIGRVHHNMNIKIGEYPLKQVTSFNVLGSGISEYGNVKKIITTGLPSRPTARV